MMAAVQVQQVGLPVLLLLELLVQVQARALVQAALQPVLAGQGPAAQVLHRAHARARAHGRAIAVGLHWAEGQQ